MKAESKPTLFRRRLKHLTDRILMRLEFFPLTLLFMLVDIARKKAELRLGRGLVCVGLITGAVESVPRDVMLWLDRVAPGSPDRRVDVCLRVSRDAADANLHDLFSVALTSPVVRSVGLYWDSSSLADDLPILQSAQDKRNPPLAATLYEEIGSQGSTPALEFLRAQHGELVLPVAAARDAQTLLKRQAGAAYAVCLNVPVELSALVGDIAVARPDVRLFLFSPLLPEQMGASSVQTLFGRGFTLHERMALVQAADAYVGRFDELGCTAVISKRPAILLGGSAPSDPISAGEATRWYPDPLDSTALSKPVLEFLALQLALGAKWTREIRDARVGIGAPGLRN